MPAPARCRFHSGRESSLDKRLAIVGQEQRGVVGIDDQLRADIGQVLLDPATGPFADRDQSILFALALPHHQRALIQFHVIQRQVRQLIAPDPGRIQGLQDRPVADADGAGLAGHFSTRSPHRWSGWLWAIACGVWAVPVQRPGPRDEVFLTQPSKKLLDVGQAVSLGSKPQGFAVGPAQVIQMRVGSAPARAGHIVGRSQARSSHQAIKDLSALRRRSRVPSLSPRAPLWVRHCSRAPPRSQRQAMRTVGCFR